ncbi:DUF4365 domain-containing protein [Paraburkholderia sp. BCC1886]|uniref:DUF4365 domain-containing protein n=1 Tax=Paraburkholderia sp. BCC1886 TaxID=2562670 RepID=UPI0011844FF4|nr:DUF4365 domain-containing protein [Paraburkholderia sp. BCC1886]
MATVKRRSFNQVKEEISFRVLRQKIPEAWVIHEYGPDYGIDCVVELFDYVDEAKEVAETLGEHFYVQLKASDSVHYTTRRAYSRGNVAKGTLSENKAEYIDIAVANFQLDVSDLLTVELLGPAVPVLLILVDIQTERAFFVCLNDYLEKIILPEDPSFFEKSSKQLQIPIQNEILPRDVNLVPLRAYGKRAKMYGAFTRFAFQKKEIERTRGLANFNPTTSAEDDLEMLRVFTESALRQEVWRGHDFWEPMQWSLNELEDVRQNLAAGIEHQDLDHFKQYCEEYVWHRLCNLSSMYEELVREWFLPTVLAQLASYPEVGKLHTGES